MKIKKFFKSQAGFTLIELLVVIGIIAVLATIGTISFGSATAKARDAKRQSEIRVINSALQIFQTGEGRYPEAKALSAGDGGLNLVTGVGEAANWAKLKTLLGLSELVPPRDGDTYCYYQAPAAAAKTTAYLVASDYESKIPIDSITAVAAEGVFVAGVNGLNAALADATGCPLTECKAAGTTGAANNSYCIKLVIGI